VDIGGSDRVVVFWNLHNWFFPPWSKVQRSKVLGFNFDGLNPEQDMQNVKCEGEKSECGEG
jgi:hypothetical protein